MYFGIKKSAQVLEKSGSQWVRDQENMVDVAKSVSFCSITLAMCGGAFS